MSTALSLESPGLLWLFSLIPLIVLLHFVRKRYKSVQVSSILFWEQVLRGENKRLLFRRFIRNLLLLFQLLAVSVLIFSLANPRFMVRSFNRDENIILIMDGTASMKAKGKEKDRVEEARKRALEVLDGMGRTSKMLIIEAGARPYLKKAFTQDRRDLQEIIQNYNATDEPGDIGEALVMALSFAGEDDEIILISDGAYDPPDIPALEKNRVRFMKVEGGSRNLGITQFQFRSLLLHPDRYEIMITVANFHFQPMNARLKLFMDQALIVDDPLILDARQEKTLIYPYSGLIGGRAEALIEVEDDLSSDNRAYTVFSGRNAIRVLLVGEGNIYLESLLNSYPRVRLTVIQEFGEFADEQQILLQDILIFDCVPAPPLESGSLVLINTSVPDAPIRFLGSVRNPAVLSWDRAHPIMNSLDLSDISISEAMSIRAGEGVKSLLRSKDTPLICAYEKEALRLVYIGFDFRRSDLPLRVAFPVLWGNILAYLYPHSLSDTSRQVQAGQPISINPDIGIKKFTLNCPDGRRESFQLKDTPFLYENTERVGFYTVDAGEREMVYAVNLLSRTESDIRPRYIPRSDASMETEDNEAHQAELLSEGMVEKQLWRALALLALVLLLIEWVFWARQRA